MLAELRWRLDAATGPMSFMNFPPLTYVDAISPHPILLVAGENAHSRYFSEDAYGAGKVVFVHATALERAGMHRLAEGQKVSFDTAEDRRSGKVAVNNIQAAQGEHQARALHSKPQWGGFLLPGPLKRGASRCLTCPGEKDT